MRPHLLILFYFLILSKSIFAQETSLKDEYLLIVQLFDVHTGIALPEEQYIKIYKQGKLIANRTKQDSLPFFFRFKTGEEYAVTAGSKCYLSSHSIILSEGEDTFLQMHLQRILHCDEKPLGPIYFSDNSRKMLKGSTATLAKYTFVFKEYPHLRIEISGHTSLKERDKMGFIRAKYIKSELVRSGIEPGRLSIKNYGNTQPVSDIYLNPTPKNQQTLNSLNQKVSFLVLSEDYQLTDKKQKTKPIKK